MNLFKTKNGEIFDLDDISRIKKNAKIEGEWTYMIIPHITVNTGNGLNVVIIDKEEYDMLIEYLKNTKGDHIGWWN